MAKTLNGMPVWGCLPNSAASAAGLQYGDIVLFANGIPTANASEYVRARGQRDDGLDLVVFRNGATFQIRLSFAESIRNESSQSLSRERLHKLSQHLADSKIVPGGGSTRIVEPSARN